MTGDILLLLREKIMTSWHYIVTGYVINSGDAYQHSPALHFPRTIQRSRT